MKKFIILIIAIVAFCSCKTSKDVSDNGRSMFAHTSYMSYAQVDSMCVVDTIPSLIEWKLSTYFDYETQEEICKYSYIKRGDFVYVITGCSEPYKVVKRVIK